MKIVENVKHLAISHFLDGRTSTDYFLFGYPSGEYRLLMCSEVALEEIPAIIEEAKKQGFVISELRADYDSKTSDTTIWLSIPYATWWSNPDWPKWSELAGVAAT